MWECVGGSVIKGETSLQGAIRETKEEVGVDLDISKGKLVFTRIRKIVNDKNYNDIMDAWLFEYNGDVDLKNATTDEVKDVKWMKKEEIRELHSSGKLVQSLSYFFDKIDI